MPEVRDGGTVDGTEHRTKDPGVQPRRLLTIKETAAFLNTSTGTIRRLVSAGKIPVVRLSRRLLVDLRDLDILIAGSKERVGW